MREHVAIVSQDPYPDLRVEREIHTLLKHGFKVTFIGKVKEKPCLVFDRSFSNFNCVDVEFDWSTYLLLEPGLSRTVKRIKHVLNDVRPEVVVAINPIAGYVMDKLEVPLVIDDHEYYYMLVLSNPIFGTPSMHILRRLRYMLGALRRRWIYRVRFIEAELASKHPMIFTNNNAKQDFAEKTGISENNLFVLKNYPSKLEVKDIGGFRVSDEVVFGYIGADLPTQLTIRDLTTTVEVLYKLAKMHSFKVLVAGINYNYSCFQGVGWLKRRELYEMLSLVDFGLATWEPHPLHKFFNPNKTYQYAIVGSVPIVTGTLESVIEDLPREAIIIHGTDKTTFKNALENVVRDLLALDKDERKELRRRVMEHARKVLVWENQEGALLDSIKKAK
ncbi:MAG: hypothetical protein DRO40_04305 [Thermoprotei archaeon]|nr:MAG: hypothetical protein DRO40_04305 [Thermoprotei archaeon]